MENRIKEAFDSIHAEEQLKDRTKKILSEQLSPKKKQKITRKGGYTPGRQLAVMAACFLMVIIGAGGYTSYFTEVSAISIDINPSIELGINCFDRVISIEGYNEDGSKLAEKLDIQFMDYIEAIDEILEDEEINSYLSADEQLSITVIGDDEEKSQEMLTNVNACAATHENVYCHSGNAKEVEAAHHAGLSFGKYQAFLELRGLDENITVEDVENLTMKEIYEWIEKLSGETNSTFSEGQDSDKESCHEGHNSGHGHNKKH